MKRLLSLLVVTAVLSTTAGCGNKKQPKVAQPTEIVAETATTKTVESKEDYTVIA